MAQGTRYETLHRTLTALLADLSALAGDTMGPTGESWQDGARHGAADAMALAQLLSDAAAGRHEAFLTFPSPSECLEQGGGER